MLCKEANDLFNSLNVSNEWNIPQKHRLDACFNCGDPDHGVPKCPKPIDQNRIDKAKAKFSTPRMEAVVEAEVDTAAEVALLVEAEAMLVIEPTLAGS